MEVVLEAFVISSVGDGADSESVDVGDPDSDGLDDARSSLTDMLQVGVPDLLPLAISADSLGDSLGDGSLLGLSDKDVVGDDENVGDAEGVGEADPLLERVMSFDKEDVPEEESSSVSVLVRDGDLLVSALTVCDLLCECVRVAFKVGDGVSTIYVALVPVTDWDGTSDSEMEFENVNDDVSEAVTSAEGSGEALSEDDGELDGSLDGEGVMELLDDGEWVLVFVFTATAE